MSKQVKKFIDVTTQIVYTREATPTFYWGIFMFDTVLGVWNAHGFFMTRRQLVKYATANNFAPGRFLIARGTFDGYR